MKTKIEQIIEVSKFYEVFPVLPEGKGKKPAVKWKKDPNKKWPTRDAGVIKDWWSRFPDHGVGSPVLPSWWVLDIDQSDLKDGYASMEELGFNVGSLKSTYWVETRSGGCHLYFKWTDECNFSHGSDVLGTGIDVRVPEQSYVRVPPTAGFRFHNKPRNIKAAPKKLIKMLNDARKKRQSKESEVFNVRLDADRLRATLFKLDPANYRSRDLWLQKMIEVNSASGGEDYGKEIFREWSAQDEHEWSDDPDEVLDREWGTLDPNGSRSAGSLLFESRRAEVMSPNFTAPRSEQPVDYDDDPKSFMGIKKTDRNFFNLTCQPIPPPADNTFETNPLYDLIYYDEMRESILYKRTPPWREDNCKGESLEESFTQELKLQLEQMYGLSYGYAALERLIPAWAYRNRFNPVTYYLDNLPEWDGHPRIDNWLHYALKCGRDDYTCKVARYSLIASVARAYEPGCKQDTMVIIDGAQGQHKSQVLKALGGDFYASPAINEAATGDKEMKMLMRSGWIVEWQEINIFNTKSASEVKRTLSTEVDLFRAPYGRAVKPYPRRFTLWATLNGDVDGRILTDPTGNRRFWPVKAMCKRGCGDIDYILNNRDQLWAEAKFMYNKGPKNGGHWWFKTEKEQELAAAVALERTTQDEWHDAISVYVQNAALNNNATVIRQHDIFDHVLHVPIRERRRGVSNRVSKIMDQLGYEYRRVYFEGVRVSSYVKVDTSPSTRPTDAEMPQPELDEVDALE